MYELLATTDLQSILEISVTEEIHVEDRTNIEHAKQTANADLRVSSYKCI